jgi:hypothetical protein
VLFIIIFGLEGQFATLYGHSKYFSIAYLFMEVEQSLALLMQFGLAGSNSVLLQHIPVFASYLQYGPLTTSMQLMQSSYVYTQYLLCTQITKRPRDNNSHEFDSNSPLISILIIIYLKLYKIIHSKMR